MKSKKTKKALTGSVLALVLCFVMLLGTTFAWFTDTASTKVNSIQSGKLDVALEMKDADGKWVSAEGKTLTFTTKDGREADKILWEPGATYELPELRIVNKGNLALKYKVEISGINGDDKLNEAIDWYYSIELSSAIPGATGWTSLSDLYKLENFGQDSTQNPNYLYPEGVAQNARTHEQVFKIIGKMKENAGNEYQDLKIDSVAITVYATQYNYEFDSATDEYDKDAEYPIAVSNITAFKGAVDDVKDGDNIVLTSDVTVGEDEQLVFKDAEGVSLNLRGSTISATSDLWYANPNDAENVRLSPISVKGGSLVITGMGKIDPGEGLGYAVDVHNGATVTIENGEFVGNVETIYVQAGTVYITGGDFSMRQTRGGSYEYMLHCSSASYTAGTANIVVTGGRFYKFNPANNKSQGEGTNFVAEGYKVVQDGDWYTVVLDD